MLLLLLLLLLAEGGRSSSLLLATLERHVARAALLDEASRCGRDGDAARQREILCSVGVYSGMCPATSLECIQAMRDDDTPGAICLVERSRGQLVVWDITSLDGESGALLVECIADARRTMNVTLGYCLHPRWRAALM